jgi:acyl-CoA thioesterase-1
MTIGRAAAVVCGIALVAAACSRPAPAPPAEQPTIDQPLANQVNGARTVTIAFLGDSLTAGLGLTQQQAYPALIEEMFHAEGYAEVEVLNAGVSGDTTAGGLRRVEQLFGPNVRILVVALGGNDALRGLTSAQTHDNLSAIIQQARERGMAVLLAGMQAPTNLGPDYREAFQAVFTRLSQEYRDTIAYVPFLLQGVAGDPALNQADGIHPNAEGARVIATLLYPKLRDLVDQLPAGG